MTVRHRKIQPGSDAQAPKLRTGLEMFRGEVLDGTRGLWGPSRRKGHHSLSCVGRAQPGDEPGKPRAARPLDAAPPPASPSPTAPLTVLRVQGQVGRGEGQEALVAHVPVQQARDLAMEAGPEARVLELEVHRRGERSPGEGRERRRLAWVEDSSSSHTLGPLSGWWERSGVQRPPPPRPPPARDHRLSYLASSKPRHRLKPVRAPPQLHTPSPVKAHIQKLL